MSGSLAQAVARAPVVDDLLVVADERWSSGELAAAAAGLAARLAALGVGPGDRVAFDALVSGNTVLLYRACWHLGAVAAALHPQIGRAGLDVSLGQLEPRVMVASPGTALAAHADGVTAIEDLWRNGRAGDSVAPVDADPGDPALVLFTSGSTGMPKGVVHTQASLAAKAVQSLDVHALGPGDAVLMPAPLAHVSGLLHGVLIPMVGGVRAVLMRRWDAGAALDLIEREQITYMVGPPTFFLDLMDHPTFTRERVESLRFLSCGGTGVTTAFADRAAAELGCLVKRSYGSTEAPTVTTSRNDDPKAAMVGTDGRAHGATELRVGDQPAGGDGEGELRVRGPEVAVGYLDAAATARAFQDGWFRTDDIGRLRDGWLTITGRRGDRIIRGGENIAVAEVEQVLEAHPGVRQAVAVGVPDERLGERVGAAVVADRSLDLDECRRWFTDQGAGRLLVPEHLLVLENLPALAVGKPDRSAVAHLLTERARNSPAR